MACLLEKITGAYEEYVSSMLSTEGIADFKGAESQNETV